MVLLRAGDNKEIEKVRLSICFALVKIEATILANYDAFKSNSCVCDKKASLAQLIGTTYIDSLPLWYAAREFWHETELYRIDDMKRIFEEVSKYANKGGNTDQTG